MTILKAELRQESGKKIKILREKGFIPAVLYGASLKNINLQVKSQDFVKVFAEAGESSLVPLEVSGKKYEVLIHQISQDPFSKKFLHVDFYSPGEKKEVEVEVPLVFEGESEAVNNLNGVLIKELQELSVKGLAHDLPREIRVDIAVLKTFEDRILVKDLKINKNLEVLRGSEDIVALVEEASTAEILEENVPAVPVVEGAQTESLVQENPEQN
ncbi:MAG: 50S ribosomal protein L25 [Candidatus Pacebacteria bacterium]|nr:50S ribosomal protein L25 [Candidatus Paceibacterota bacterium]